MTDPLKDSLNQAVAQESTLSPAKEVLRTYLSLTALSLSVVVLHFAVGIITRRLGLHIPGLSGIVWMPLLVIGKMRWRTRISATYMAAVSSILVLWLAPIAGLGKIGGMWLFPFLRYGIPGIALDVLWPFVGIFAGKPLSYFAVGALITGLAHTCKAIFVMLTWHLGFGQYVLNHFTLGMIVLLHFGLGVAGGAIGALIGYPYATNQRSLKNNL